MKRITIDNRNHHLLMTWFWAEVRRGNFPVAYALLWADAGLAPDEYAAIGGVLDSLLREPDSPAKSKALAALALDVTRWLGLRNRSGDDPRRKALVDSLWLLSQRHDDRRPWDATREYDKVQGYVAGAATILLGMGTPAEVLAREPDILAHVALAVIEANWLPVSITDVQDTLREMTRFGPITDWVVPEEVAQLRDPMHQRLLALLRSPSAPEVLRELVRYPDAIDWLVVQMGTPAERVLLRTAVLAMRSKGKDSSRGSH